jgi:hypothetical protein
VVSHGISRVCITKGLLFFLPVEMNYSAFGEINCHIVLLCPFLDDANAPADLIWTLAHCYEVVSVHF